MGKRQLDPFGLQQGRNLAIGMTLQPAKMSRLCHHKWLINCNVRVFTGLLDHLAKGKAAGAGGVPNELLQALPHKLFSVWLLWCLRIPALGALEDPLSA